MFNILKYNSFLADSSEELDFKEYIIQVNNVSNSNIDFSLMKLYEYHNRNECCIPHTYLYSFKILSMKRGKYLESDIINLLKSYKEGTDFIVRHTAVKQDKNILINNEYYIHPNAFRIMLMRLHKYTNYINYFVFIENCIYYYSDYREKMNKINCNNKNTKDSELLKNIEEKIINIESLLNIYLI
jgi:hypothetical protein